MEKNKAIKKDNAVKVDPKVVKVAIILMFGSLAPLLDSTMANVAVNTISQDLHSSMSMVQWGITGYVLAMGIAVPLSGWASACFGSRQVYMFSLILFLIGSIFSGVAWNIDSLIAFRFLQGLGGGLLIPTMMNLLLQVSGGTGLGSVMSIIGVPSALGPVLGPVIGGIIVDHLSWRWIFYINVPIIIVAVLLAAWGLPKNEIKNTKAKLDFIGVTLLASFFTAFIYGITKVSTEGGFFNQTVMIPLCIGVVLLMLYIFYAWKRPNQAVIKLQLFKVRNLSASSILLLFSGITINGAMLLLPLYYQNVRGLSVAWTGMALIPQGVGMLLTRSQVGKLTDRIGARWVTLVCLFITIISTAPFIYANAETSNWLLILTLFVRGIGLGGIMVAIMTDAYIGLDKNQIPQASMATRVFQNIGGAFGSAILATIIQHQLLHGSFTGKAAIVHAYQYSFAWSVGFTLIAFIPALFLTHNKVK